MDQTQQAPSWKHIVGFACHQGFIFSLFYMGSNRGVEVAGTVIERADLLLTLVVMGAAFLSLRARIMPILASLRAWILVAALAVLLIAGSIAPSLPSAAQPLVIVGEGLLVGVALAGLFMAWGMVLSTGSPRTVACEVFAATGFAAAISFACAFLPTIAALVAPKLCAAAGAAVLILCLREHTTACPSRPAQTAGTTTPKHTVRPARNARPAPMRRMAVGAATFGVAAGVMEAYRSDPGMLAAPAFPSTLLILALFCIAVLQSLFVKKPAEEESLGSMYRIAMLVIMAGFLFAPILDDTSVPGEAIILAGYLGLVAAFMAFFLVMGHIAKTDAAESFAWGLAAIYWGEAGGIAAANMYDLAIPNEAYSYAIMAIAGMAILVAYLFLFTERDFRAFSAVVDTTDAMEKACTQIAQTYGLSAREAEVMTLALQGRSNERIAQELFIAKSTADTHMRRIYGKCGITGRQELIDLGQRTAEAIRQQR